MRPTRCNNSDLLLISSISTCFGHLYAHRQEIQLRSAAYSCLSCCSCCEDGESVGKMCALCGECCLTLSGNILHTVHKSCHPTLQHHNSYNRTDNYRQWNAVGSPDDGHKDARNMLRHYWLPINHYLLHLVGLSLLIHNVLSFKKYGIKYMSKYKLHICALIFLLSWYYDFVWLWQMMVILECSSELGGLMRTILLDQNGGTCPM